MTPALDTHHLLPPAPIAARGGQRRAVGLMGSGAQSSPWLPAGRGVALALPDEQILASLVDWARHEGIFLSPEGAAATAAYDHLLVTGLLESTDRVVLFITGGGLKYTDVTAEAMGLNRPGPGKTL